MAYLSVTSSPGAPVYRACLHALLRSLAIVEGRGLSRSCSESGPSVCDLCPFLGSGVQTIGYVNSLRGLCVSGQECVLPLVLPARCHQHGLSTHQRLQPFTFFATRSGSIGCANARHLGSYFSQNTLTHVLPCWQCKPDFHSCSIVWICLPIPPRPWLQFLLHGSRLWAHGALQVPSWS